jgi:DNA-binding HxlR family transcriptional regulator
LRKLIDPLTAQIIGYMAGEPVDPSSGEGARRNRERIAREADVPGAHKQYKITPQGREVYAIGKLFEAWVASAPGGGLPSGGDGAREAKEALVDSWASALLHALAAGPQSVATLEGAIEGADRAALERRLQSMSLLGMVERRHGEEGEPLYALTDWLREGIVPLAVAARHERAHAYDDARPIAPLDAAAALQLTLPLVVLPGEPSGSCRLAVELGGGVVVGVTAKVEQGRVVACPPHLEEDVDASVAGDMRAWFRAVIDGGVKRVSADGDRRLSRAIVIALHERLCAIS